MRAFYEYHSCLMEPWDGPASIAFTDGQYIGAVLDRNGLRPSRYYLTHDDRVIMASEVGVLPVRSRDRQAQRPTEAGSHVPDRLRAGAHDSRRRTQERHRVAPSLRRVAPNAQRLKLADLHVDGDARGFDPDTLLSRVQSFGYTTETMQFMLRPMIEQKRDPVGSMGNDSALGGSERPAAAARMTTSSSSLHK